MPRIEDLPLPDASAIRAKTNANWKALRDFTAAGIIELSERRSGHSALGLKLKFVAPDYLWLSLNGAMGIEVGTLCLNQDRYELSFGMPRVHAQGLIEDFEFPDNLGLDLRGQDIYNIMLPLRPLSAIPDSARVEKSLPAQQYQLIWCDTTATHQLWADPIRPVITRELIQAPEGDTLIYRQIGGFKKRVGVHFPYNWVVRLGREDQVYLMRLRLSKLEINTGLKPEIWPGEEAGQEDSLEVENDG